MNLYDHYFYSKDINACFTDEAIVEAMLGFEAALAMAQAQHGLIPLGAAEAIQGQCRAEAIDMDKLRKDVALGGNVCIPLVKQLTALVKSTESAHSEGSKYVHFGATSQDVIDTATMIQAQKAVQQIADKTDKLIGQLSELAQRHRQTVMIGRSFMQHARPITFGYKVATWLDGIFRTRKKIEDLLKGGFALQLGGAVGSLASMDNKGWAVAETMAASLQLTLPPTPYHTQRDRFVEIASTLGMLVGNMGKIAQDISLMMQTEIGEVFEPSAKGKGGSSTMPHKRNPVSCVAILANARRIPPLVSVMFSSMVQDHERATGAWHAEWETLADIIKLTGGAVHQTVIVTDGLEVNTLKMRSNLEATQGLIFAENISLALAEKIGKQEAHELVESWCKAADTVRRDSYGEGVHLKDFILQNEERTNLLGIEQIEQLFNPENSIGLCLMLTDNILKNG